MINKFLFSKLSSLCYFCLFVYGNASRLRHFVFVHQFYYQAGHLVTFSEIQILYSLVISVLDEIAVIECIYFILDTAKCFGYLNSFRLHYNPIKKAFVFLFYS